MSKKRVPKNRLSKREQSYLFTEMQIEAEQNDLESFSGLLRDFYDLTNMPIQHFTYKGEWYGVLTSLAYHLGYASAHHAALIIDAEHIKHVHDVIPQTTRISCSLQLRSDQLLVTRHGLYQLMFSSNRPEAKAFRTWVCNLIDSALGISGKTLLSDAAIREQHRLGCNQSTAIWRSKERDLNRDEINGGNVGRKDLFYNGIYMGATGFNAAELRHMLGGAPLDHANEMMLTMYHLAKLKALHVIKENDRVGKPYPTHDIPKMCEGNASQIRALILKDYYENQMTVGLSTEQRNGKSVTVTAVIPKQLEGPKREPTNETPPSLL